jgi:hypothetical protein
MSGRLHALTTLVVAVATISACGRIDFGGVQDAGARDDGGDANAPSPCSMLTGVLLCDGFEADLSRWQGCDELNGVVSIDSGRAFRGQHSLHGAGSAAAAGMQVKAMVTEETILATSPAELYVRAFVLAPTLPPGDQLAWANLSQDASPYAGISFILADDKANPFFYNSTSGSAVYTRSAATIPSGDWTCIEWRLDFATDALDGHLAAAYNDIVVPDLSTVQQTQSSPALHDINIGLFLPATGIAHLPFDFWIDEVIISTTPIGCAL